ncbi:hypothetical protein ACQEVG_34150 [Streptomyces sp. CA-135486]|uniref:hypothetical protein n=1 Tax=Streptomyces sp. CA-135486 TaxID=3240049 RepID=UPI003D93292E
MNGYVMSRGHARPDDYDFLGAAPPMEWWKKYHPYADFEYPTLLVESRKDQWQLYLSGIRSERTDAVGTAIRFTLVLSGRCGDEAAPRAARLAAQWLADLAAGKPAGEVGRCLDLHFPGEAVDTLRGRRDTEAADETGRLLDQALSAVQLLPTPGAAKQAMESDPPDPSSWLGGLPHDRHRELFISCVEDLLSGEMKGRALLLNLVARASEAPELKHGERLFVLSERGDDLSATGGLVPLTGKASGPERIGPDPTARRSRMNAKKTVIAIGATIALGLTIWYVVDRLT